MEAMRQTWTDDRMDDLVKRVDDGFDRVDRQFEHVDRRFEQVDRRFEQVDHRFEQVHADIKTLGKEMASRHELQTAVSGLRNEMEIRFSEVDKRLDKMDAKIDDRFNYVILRFDRLEANLLHIGGGLVGAVLVGMLGLIATQI